MTPRLVVPLLLLPLAFARAESAPKIDPMIEQPGRRSAAIPEEPEPTPTPLPPHVWIERFDAAPGSDYTKLGWSGGQEVNGEKDHVLVKDGDRVVMKSRYLPGTEAKHIGREIEWDTVDYPWLRWRWRAHKFPTNARVLESKVSDAAAQIYLVWKVRRLTYVVKYFWAVLDKVGEELHQGNFLFGKLFGLILRQGGTPDVWHTETRNIHEDYIRGFGEPPKGPVRGIGLLSDADETKSQSEADYSDIEVFRTEPPAFAEAPARQARVPAPDGPGATKPSGEVGRKAQGRPKKAVVATPADGRRAK